MRLAIAVVTLLLLAPAAEAAKQRPPCRPKGARTIEGSGAVRVYELRGRVVACAYANGRRMRLGRRPVPDEVEGFMRAVVRGRWVAWQLTTGAGSSQGPYYPDRLRLADARKGREVDLGEPGCRAPGEAGPHFTSFDLTAQGRLAWGCVGSHGIDSILEVRKYDADGPGLLDRVEGDPQQIDYIAGYSVAIAPDGGRNYRGRVYWSRTSGPRSADLR